MPALVSVILPTYNRAVLLVGALESVLGQTHDELELIVVDDGSTDDTPATVRERYGDDPRVRYHHQANSGVSVARNAGMRLARGDYIAFIDSDDLWKPWKLELQLRCLELAPEAGMLWTDMEAISPRGEEIAPAYLRSYYPAYRHYSHATLFGRSIALGDRVPAEIADRRLYVGEIYSQMIMGNLVHTPTTLVRRERLERVGLFDAELRAGGEDYEFWLRICREGPVAYADVSSIAYRIGMDDNISNASNALTYAESYVATIEPLIVRDSDRITLAPAMIAKARAYGQLWIGRSLLLRGSPRQARAHLRRSLRLRPAQPEALVLAAISCAPSAVAVRLARALRGARRRLRRARG